jgi:hypothetical protein
MNDIHQIINDITVLEPSLKGREEELRKIISSLLAARPHTALDEAFVLELRKTLLQKMKAVPSHRYSFSSMYNLRFALAGAFVAVVIVVPATIALMRNPSASPVFDLSNITVNDKGDTAFGPLALFPNKNEIASKADSTAVQSAGSRMGVMSFAVGEPTTSQENVQRFTYVGKAVSLPENAPVYHRVIDQNISGKVGQIISDIKTGLVELSSFGSFDGNYISLIQPNEKDGYAVTFNPKQEEVDIGSYWSETPAENSPQNNILDSDTATSLATQFLLDHHISSQPYGAPIIPTTEKFGVFGSDTNNTVVFPLIIDGNPVVQDGGVPYGMNVTIDKNLKRVMAMSGIMSRHYESSQYPLLKNLEEVLVRVEQQIYGFDVSSQTKLDTPEQVLLFVSKFNQENGREDSYLVPALRFPIVAGSNQNTAHYIVVPITADGVQ